MYAQTPPASYLESHSGFLSCGSIPNFCVSGKGIPSHGCRRISVGFTLLHPVFLILTMISSLTIIASQAMAGDSRPEQDAQDAQPQDQAGSPDQAPPAGLPDPPAEELTLDPYAVDQLTFQYLEDHPDHPAVDIYLDVEVDLVETTAGYMSPREGFTNVRIRLGEIPNLTTKLFFQSALQEILNRVVERMQQEDLLGVYVFPNPTEIQQGTGQDLREIGNDSMTMLIATGIIRQTRTLAFGERFPDEEREDNVLHRRIIDRSPLKVWDKNLENPRLDLLRRTPLDSFLARQNRLPGRRIDAAISAADDPAGGVVLDFLIAENEPWLIYGQVSNTGTKQTDRVRERFGLIRNQFSNNDDILSLEFVTASFDQANAIIGYYEAPFFDSESLRFRVGGSWSEFTASDVGLADESFTGESWSASIEAYLNIFQKGEFFIDLTAGARWMFVNINNQFVNIGGQSDFFLPFVGFRIEQVKTTTITQIDVRFEMNLDDVAGTDRAEINKLGRLFVDEDWSVLKWKAEHSFFLEPILNREGWEDISTRETSTLAHEIALTFRGQYAFDNRLIPQAEQVVGGLYSVRGYPESGVAGDTVFMGSLEYRFHFPRSLPYETEPSTLFNQPFRRVPQEPYGVADWDLVFRTFLDFGQSTISDPLSFENDQTLMSAGLGVEFSLYRNINIRVDWGYVLEALKDDVVPTGSNRAHVVATFIF